MDKETLRQRLAEAEETLEAIRTGKVDAIVVAGSDGEKIYTLSSAEFPYRQLVEEMQEGVATLSLADGTILYCNQSFARLLGVPLEHIIGSSIDVFIPPSYRDVFHLAMRRPPENKLPGGEFPLTTAAGAQVNALVSFTRQQHVAETVSIIVTDLTERIRAEEALRRANKELEAFSYTISHDLRAPLRAIRGYLSILEETVEEKLTGEEREHLNVIRNSATELASMTESLLEFSRLHRTGLQKSLFSMDEIVRSALTTVRSEGYESVEVDLHPLGDVYGDRSLLGNVVRNLLSNAFKFSKPNPNARIEIGCRPDGGETIFYVRDNGVGFDMNYADKLFGVFQRLHSKEEFEGTGVGLAIASRIVQRHGGKMWAESKLEKGATFYFSLPTE